jgi:hypothetical protein
MIWMHQIESPAGILNELIYPNRVLIHHGMKELRVQQLIKPLLCLRNWQCIELLQIHHGKLSYKWEDGDINP